MACPLPRVDAGLFPGLSQGSRATSSDGLLERGRAAAWEDTAALRPRLACLLAAGEAPALGCLHLASACRSAFLTTAAPQEAQASGGGIGSSAGCVGAREPGDLGPGEAALGGLGEI